MEEKRAGVRDCPHCAEEIKNAAKICKHCKQPVDPVIKKVLKKTERRSGCVDNIRSLTQIAGVVLVVFVVLCAGSSIINGLRWLSMTDEEIAVEKQQIEEKRALQETKRKADVAARIESLEMKAANEKERTAKRTALLKTGDKQKNLCSILLDYRTKYERGGNAMLLSSLRGNRKIQMDRFGRRFVGLKLVLRPIIMGDNGDAILVGSIEGCRTFGIMATLPRNSQPFNKMVSAKKGDVVKVSGSWIRDPSGLDAFANQGTTDHGYATETDRGSMRGAMWYSNITSLELMGTDDR